jgi:16S rRNA (cytosine1402-N4)-methyltransferase
MTAGHVPVLLEEAVKALVLRPDGVYLDATGGAGGHAAAVLEKLDEAGRLFIGDYHRPSVENLGRLFGNDARVTVRHVRFSRIFEVFDTQFAGILADLGISSTQLADQRLGIAFISDAAPLDMRLDDALHETAADILATRSRDELADIFFHLGGERAARKIAAAVASDRQKKAFATAGELRGLCERVLGRYYRSARIHPATKVFQALRIAVNRELEEIQSLLRTAPGRLAPGGRLVVIAFHEGEDRLVKTHFAQLVADGDFRQPHRKAVKPAAGELAANPRARSARMRVLEKVEPLARRASP